MNIAIELAKRASEFDEVPVGSIVVKNDIVIGSGYNKNIQLNNVVSHAEIIALNTATQNQGTWRLTKSTLYTTAEPCIMCCGAILHCRVERVVFGVLEPKFGGIISCAKIFDISGLNHKIKYAYGCYEKEIKELMGNFFKNKRGK
jgi:tRNA(adenine34) deaminase